MEKFFVSAALCVLLLNASVNFTNAVEKGSSTYVSPSFMSMLIYFQSYKQKLSFSCRRPIMNLVVSHILDTIFLLINLILCMVVFTDGEDTKDPRRAPVHTCVEYIYQPECQPSYCSQYCHEAQRTAIKSRCDLKKGLCLCYFQCVYPPN